jgi:hypothetical protein
MEFLQKLLNNPKKTVLMILAFVALFLSYLFFGADDAQAVEFEAGPTYTGEFNGGFGVMFSERFAGKYDVGITLISEQDWEAVHATNNGNFWAAYVAKRPDRFWKFLPSEFSLGPSAWIKTQSPINGCILGYHLGLKYRFGDHVSVGVRHWSNAGSCKPNRGQDLLTVGWTF